MLEVCHLKQFNRKEKRIKLTGLFIGLCLHVIIC